MHKKRQALILVAAVASALALSAAPVWADHGGSDSGGTSGSSGSSDSSGSSGSGDTATTDGGHSGSGDSSGSTETSHGSNSGSGDSTDETKPEVEALQAHAKDLLTTERSSGKEHTTAERQQACEARQASIDTRVSNYATAAQKHLTAFDGVFTKVQAFYTSNGLSVSNYDTLVATATNKQTLAQQAVAALAALNVKIDCTQADPAQSVATVKAAVSGARTALQDYRSAIKDLIVAIKGVSSTDSKEGGNQ